MENCNGNCITAFDLISMLVLQSLALATLIPYTSQISFANQRWMNGLYGSHSRSFRGVYVFVTVTAKCFRDVKENGNYVQMLICLAGSSVKKKCKISALKALISDFSHLLCSPQRLLFPEYEICLHHSFLYLFKYILPVEY